MKRSFGNYAVLLLSLSLFFSGACAERSVPLFGPGEADAMLTIAPDGLAVPETLDGEISDSTTPPSSYDLGIKYDGVATDPCQHSALCYRKGYCTTSGGTCIAGTDEDCRQSEFCGPLGLCSAREGECIAAIDQDCHQSKFCAINGACSARNAICVAATAEDCRQSTFCRIYGYCSPAFGECHAGSDADCLQSEHCRVFGFCTATSGFCF